MIFTKCCKCKNIFQINKDLFEHRKKHKSKIICPICLIKSKKERYKKISEAAKKQWNSYSDLERKERSEKAKQGIANMSLEAKQKRSINSSNATKKCMAQRSKEDLNKIRQKISQWNKNRYANMSVEERAKIGKKISIGLNNRTIEEKRISNLKRSKTLKRTIASMSPEEQIKRWKHLQDFRHNMTKEEYQKWEKNRIIKYNEYINNLSINPNINELDLMNYFRINNINFQYQSFNTIIHPDFNKIFPNNNITGSNFINPYHKWDFRLFTQDGEVLVDIDGSIHFKKSYSMIHPYTKKKYNMLDYFKFKDSQRIYQTDNLPAFIILCPDDNLSEDSLVYDLLTKETFDFKTFLSKINWMNLSKKEKSKAIKSIL